MGLLAMLVLEYVSIHTPTQGVTPGFLPLSKGIHVSIHTPTQGVTQPRIMM